MTSSIWHTLEQHKFCVHVQRASTNFLELTSTTTSKKSEMNWHWAKYPCAISATNQFATKLLMPLISSLNLHPHLYIHYTGIWSELRGWGKATWLRLFVPKYLYLERLIFFTRRDLQQFLYTYLLFYVSEYFVTSMINTKYKVTLCCHFCQSSVDEIKSQVKCLIPKLSSNVAQSADLSNIQKSTWLLISSTEDWPKWQGSVTWTHMQQHHLF